MEMDILLKYFPDLTKKQIQQFSQIKELRFLQIDYLKFYGNILNNSNELLITEGLNMDCFYQHDLIYKLNKQNIKIIKYNMVRMIYYYVNPIL